MHRKVTQGPAQKGTYTPKARLDMGPKRSAKVGTPEYKKGIAQVRAEVGNLESEVEHQFGLPPRTDFSGMGAAKMSAAGSGAKMSAAKMSGAKMSGAAGSGAMMSGAAGSGAMMSGAAGAGATKALPGRTETDIAYKKAWAEAVVEAGGEEELKRELERVRQERNRYKSINKTYKLQGNPIYESHRYGPTEDTSFLRKSPPQKGAGKRRRKSKRKSKRKSRRKSRRKKR